MLSLFRHRTPVTSWRTATRKGWISYGRSSGMAPPESRGLGKNTLLGTGVGHDKDGFYTVLLFVYENEDVAQRNVEAFNKVLAGGCLFHSGNPRSGYFPRARDGMTAGRWSPICIPGTPRSGPLWWARGNSLPMWNEWRRFLPHPEPTPVVRRRRRNRHHRKYSYQGGLILDSIYLGIAELLRPVIALLVKGIFHGFILLVMGPMWFVQFLIPHNEQGIGGARQTEDDPVSPEQQPSGAEMEGVSRVCRFHWTREVGLGQRRQCCW